MRDLKQPAHSVGNNRNDPEPRPKKPYQRPAFRCERMFETMALACGKIQGTQASCHFNRQNS